MSTVKRWMLGFYEIDRAWGGSEEGGWWFDCGQLVRPLKMVIGTEEQAWAQARRANDLLDVLQRRKRDVGSVIYSGGRHRVCVYENSLPAAYPEQRPHYE